MINNKRKLLMLIPVIFIIFTTILSFPSLAFAQEEDTVEEELVEPDPTLTLDVSYSEVSAYGIIGERFEFQIDVTLNGPEDQFFEIIKEIPPGWSIQVSPPNQDIDIPVIKLKPEKKETLTIICRPLIKQEPEEYTFKMSLNSLEGEEPLEESAEFIAIVKPAGVLNISTTTGMLNTEVRPDRDNIYTLILENTGSAPVEDISLSTPQEPEGWLVEFEDKIDIIQVGERMEIETNIIPPNRTIAGDYTIRFLVQSDEDTDFIDLRTVVETPLIWRILGIALIALVIAGIAVVFERLGRR